MVNNPHHRLTVLYEKIQRVLAKMPADAAYRTSTETIVSERRAAVLAVRGRQGGETGGAGGEGRSWTAGWGDRRCWRCWR